MSASAPLLFYASIVNPSEVLPVESKNKKEKTRLNYITHFALGARWGAAYKGLRGSKATALVFPAIYTSDVATVTALGLVKPWKWTRKETAIDVVD